MCRNGVCRTGGGAYRGWFDPVPDRTAPSCVWRHLAHGPDLTLSTESPGEESPDDVAVFDAIDHLRHRGTSPSRHIGVRLTGTPPSTSS
jgi:hypothetical protein